MYCNICRCKQKYSAIMSTATLTLEPSVPFSDIKTSIDPPKEPELKPYTMDEINQMIDKSLADIKAGRVLTWEEVDRDLKEKYPWLND